VAALDAETLDEARRLVSLYPERRSALVPVCHLAQARHGWLAPEVIEDIATLLELTPAEVRGTASFYEMLRIEPVGRYLVGICTNIACMLGGAYELVEHAEEVLGTRAGSTTPDGQFTLEEVECIADCDRAPCLQVNYRYFGNVTGEDFDRLVADLRSGRLSAEVPGHGVLCRVRREQGLEVPPEQVASERAAADRSAESRAAQKGSA
jgi:NADH-quinone oxidoreductase subunit E